MSSFNLELYVTVHVMQECLPMQLTLVTPDMICLDATAI